MNYQQAIHYLDELVVIARNSEDMGVSKWLSINNLMEDVKEVLQKHAFFESQVLSIGSWFVDNKDCLVDDATKVAGDNFRESNVDGFIDEVDLEFIVEDIVDKLQEGILNVLDSYKID